MSQLSASLIFFSNLQLLFKVTNGVVHPHWHTRARRTTHTFTPFMFTHIGTRTTTHTHTRTHAHVHPFNVHSHKHQHGRHFSHFYLFYFFPRWRDHLSILFLDIFSIFHYCFFPSGEKVWTKTNAETKMIWHQGWKWENCVWASARACVHVSARVHGCVWEIVRIGFCEEECAFGCVCVWKRGYV